MTTSGFEWTPEIEALIIEKHSGGAPLIKICTEPGMPTRTELSRHQTKILEFHNRMVVANQMFCQYQFEEILNIADDTSDDWKTRYTTGGLEVQDVNHEAINRSRVRIDARLKVLERIDPERYAGKKSTGKAVAPVGAAVAKPVREVSDLDLARRTAFLLAKGQRAIQAHQPMPTIVPATPVEISEDVL